MTLYSATKVSITSDMAHYEGHPGDVIAEFPSVQIIFGATVAVLPKRQRTNSKLDVP